MPLDPSVVGVPVGPAPVSWTSRDAIIYALGVGAGHRDLAFTTEKTSGVDHQVLPTAATVFGEPVMGTLRSIGDFDLAKLLHVEHEVELFGAIPAEVSAMSTSTVRAMYDKGSRAIVVLETVTSGPDDVPLFTNRSTLMIGGAGGFGGDPGPSREKLTPPDRDPDEVVPFATSPDQALLYRLSGDVNPLHSDPAFARRAGFDAPILHGLCTHGFTGRALLDRMCGGDVARFRRMTARFTATVVPGDELAVSIWRAEDGQAIYRTSRGDGTVVLEGTAAHG